MATMKPHLCLCSKDPRVRQQEPTQPFAGLLGRKEFPGQAGWCSFFKNAYHGDCQNCQKTLEAARQALISFYQKIARKAQNRHPEAI